MCATGTSRNLGGPDASEVNPDGHRVTKPRPRRAGSARRGSEPGADFGTVKRKATKRDGMGGGESEHRVVPVKRGN